MSTHGFEALLQIRTNGIQKIVDSLHAIGRISHRARMGYGDEIVSVVLDAPQIETSLSTGPQQGSARVRIRCFVNARDRSDPLGVGRHGVVDVRLEPLLAFHPGGTTIDFGQALRASIEVPSPEPSAVTVIAQGAFGASELVEIVRDLLGDVTDAYADLPPLRIGPKDPRVGAARTDARGFLLGLDSRTTTSGDIFAPTSTPAEDWSLWVEPQSFLSMLQQALDNHMPTPRRLADDCTIDAGVLGCVNRSRVDLVDLTAELTSGGVDIVGDIRVDNSAFFVPDADGRVRVAVTFGVDATGRLTVTTGAITTELANFGAQILDFFSGGAFRSELVQGLERVLARGQSQFDGFLGLDSDLRSLLNFYQPGQETIVLRPTVIEVSSLDVRVGGTVVPSHGAVEPRPIHDTILVSHSSQGAELLVDATRGWTPGGELEWIRYEFPDGTHELFDRSSAAFVVQRFVPRQPNPMNPFQLVDDFTVCMTMRNRSGAQRTSCGPAMPCRRGVRLIRLASVVDGAEHPVPARVHPPVTPLLMMSASTVAEADDARVAAKSAALRLTERAIASPDTSLDAVAVIATPGATVQFGVASSVKPGPVSIGLRVVDCGGRPEPNVSITFTPTEGDGGTATTDETGTITITVPVDPDARPPHAGTALFGYAVVFDLPRDADTHDSLVVLLRSEEGQLAMESKLDAIAGQLFGLGDRTPEQEALLATVAALRTTNAITFASRELGIEPKESGLELVRALEAALVIDP